FDLRIAGTPAKARERAMLALAELRGLGAGQDQRITLGQVGPREGTDQRLLVLRQRRVAVLEERLGVQLDLPCGRREAARYAVLLLGVLAIACLERHPHPARVFPERVERHAGGVELVAVRRLHVAVPEVSAEAEPGGQV